MFVKTAADTVVAVAVVGDGDSVTLVNSKNKIVNKLLVSTKVRKQIKLNILKTQSSSYLGTHLINLYYVLLLFVVKTLHFSI